MKIHSVLISALFSLAPAFAQTHLDSDVPKYDFDVAYQNNIRAALREAYADDVILRMIAEPSFTPEYAVGLRKTVSGAEIFGLRVKIQVWSFQNRAELKKEAQDCDPAKNPYCSEQKKYAEAMPDDARDIKVDRCEAPISDVAAAHIEEAWRQSLTMAGTGGDDRVGVDGEFYYFAMNDGGRHLSGKVWTPDANSLPGKLVTLGIDMSNLCADKGNATITQIDKEASDLVQKLKQSQ